VEIVPAIDILQGRCVRLQQGDYARQTVFADDPCEVAQRWQALGATRLHVVDLDGARAGLPTNQAVIRELTRRVSVPVQVGGGIRTLTAARAYLEEGGADRVVIGTSAVREPALVADLCQRWPERIVVAVDARDGVVAIEGWQEASGIEVAELVARLEELGVRRLLYTDISRDGMLTEPNFEAIARLISNSDLCIIASGGVATLDHLRTLREIGVEAVIIGRALYTGAIELGDALRVAGESWRDSGVCEEDDGADETDHPLL
jgi:phosphoribosylformimino-5-aminoimidazole carboxamide ribotide isomerase